MDKAKEVVNELEVCIVAYSEQQINFKHKDNINGMGHMFNEGEAEIRTQTRHNVHENVGRRQIGVTSLLLYGPLIEQYTFEASVKDDTGLGRWVVMTLQGSDGVTTWIVCGYNPCSTPRRAIHSTYQQHRRYLVNRENNLMCPCTRF